MKNKKDSLNTEHAVGSVHYARLIDDAPNLKSIECSAYFNSWRGSAPKLKSIGGRAWFGSWRGSAPNLESIENRKFEWKETFKF